MTQLLRFIKNLFPIKARNFEEFVNILQRKRCTEVFSSVIVYEPQGVFTATVGNIGMLRYTAVFTSKTPTGRSVKYEHMVVKQFGSTWGFSDSGERSKNAIKTLIEADKLLGEIRKRDLTVKTALLRTDGTPYTQDMLRKLNTYAKKVGLV